MNWIRSVWLGQARLGVVFWLYGVLGVFVLSLAIGALILPMAALGPVGLLLFLGLSSLLLLLYVGLVLVGIWRSAGQYAGWRAWAWLARLGVMAGCVAVGSAIWLNLRLLVTQRDSSRNSRNVAATLHRDAAYPWTGFWKGSCEDSFGLIIEPASAPGRYSVSFCGPGGCFAPGTYRPDTPLAGDPAYRLVDTDHIEVQGRDGSSRYTRCE